MSSATPDDLAPAASPQTIARLARDASIELNVQDLKDLDASRALLSGGKRIYISHLPRQQWDETVFACRKVSTAGFDPIPHIPVRLIDSAATLDRLLEGIVGSGAREVLLIAGDYAHAAGPYASVVDVLRAGHLYRHGMTRVSLAGHPEGHPSVALEEIRRAEIEKATLADQLGLEATFVTQFFFEAPPFLHWAAGLRAGGAHRSRLIAGLSGPASIPTLLRYARRCGVGPSIRALAARPNAIMKLLGEHGPEDVMHDLAVAHDRDATLFNGLHFFCFGGYLRTCEWLNRLAAGQGQ